MKYSVLVALVAVSLIASGCSKTSQSPDSSATQTTPINSSPATETNKTSTKTPSTSPATPSTSPAPSTKSGSYTMAQVKEANSKTKCWTVVNGNVYDLTSYISKHPGGIAQISSICGKDGTTAFTKQHGGKSKPEQTLASLKIGVLAP